MATDIFEHAKVLRERDEDALQSELVRLREDLFRARFSLNTGQLTDTSRLQRVRRQIARVETVQNERRRAASGRAAGSEG